MCLDSLEKIKKYEGPVLISHGDSDEVIPCLFRDGIVPEDGVCCRVLPAHHEMRHNGV